MAETFGSRLRRFALAVDIVDDDIFRQMWELILQYISGQFNPVYWALLVESEVNKERGLSARECSNSNKPSFSVKKDDSAYNGFAAYSFLEEKSLWIVSSDKQPLGPDTPLHDHWSKSNDFPRLDRPTNNGVRTAIFVPLRWKGKTLGVLDIQSVQYHEITKKIMRELELLADAISVLLLLSDTNQSRREQTLEAINMYQRALKDEALTSLAKPQIFVASSSGADEAVMNTILDVLESFGNQLRVHYWRKSSASGNINLEILKQIRASQFGLCYFSEPVKDTHSPFKYQDNVNVIFEAGMFQSLTNPNAADYPTGWIPVREAQPYSPPPPFDFAQQRMIIVERKPKNDHPNLEKLQEELKARIEYLLQ